MVVRLILMLLCTCLCVKAQEPFGDGKNIHQRTIFEGKAVIDIPDVFSYNSCVDMTDEQYFEHSANYHGTHTSASMSFNLIRALQTEDSLLLDMRSLKSFYNDQYHFILRDEFVNKGADSYLFYEGVLKDEYYDENGIQTIDYSDGSVSPGYFLFYYVLQNGKATRLTFSYSDSKTGLKDFRRQAAEIISSYKLIHVDNQ